MNDASSALLAFLKWAGGPRFGTSAEIAATTISFMLSRLQRQCRLL